MSDPPAGVPCGMDRRRLAVIGAGVIGQVYAARLAAAGHDVHLLARGRTFEQLQQHGVRLLKGRAVEQRHVSVVRDAVDLPPVDAAYAAVRGDQLNDLLPLLDRLDAPTVVTLSNAAGEARAVTAALGRERTVLAFPGVGGTRTMDGVEYHEIPQQPTTVGHADGLEQPVTADLEAAGFQVVVTRDMPDWLATHAVFITGIGAAILAAGGAGPLAADRNRTGQMIRSVRDGFRALERSGVKVVPGKLNTIFVKVPALFSVPYWQRQLRGSLGELALGPHIMATRDSEFTWLTRQALNLTGNAPLLAAAVAAAGVNAG